MAEITTVARPYAEALARMAGEGGTWSAWSAMLDVATKVAGEAQVAALTNNPSLSASEVAEVIIAICGDQLNNEGANLVRVLAENKRFASLPEIARLFEEIKAEQEGVLESRITTAFALSETQLSALVDKLQNRFGCRINVTQAIDPELIGGVIIQVGDEVMDASVRGRLAGMAATLKA